MKSTHTFAAALLSLVCTGSLALATPRPSTTAPQSHGDRAYRDALQFAQRNNLQHFTVQSGGIQRLVVNVTSAKIPDWCNVFSKGNCYIEPFFNASNRSEPGWSMLRMGEKSFQRYGEGEQYRTSTWGGRVAFPVSLTQQELASTETAIRTSRNLPFNYNGGIWSGTGQNCTDWVTCKIGQFTGVTTASVKHHMSSLATGYHSPRMSVMAVMSDQPIQGFGRDQLRMYWNEHH